MVEGARLESAWAHRVPWVRIPPSPQSFFRDDCSSFLCEKMPLAAYRLMRSRSWLTRKERARVRMWADEVNRAGGEFPKSDLP